MAEEPVLGPRFTSMGSHNGQGQRRNTGISPLRRAMRMRGFGRDDVLWWWQPRLPPLVQKAHKEWGTRAPVRRDDVGLSFGRDDVGLRA